ncbi:hypothetical protein A7982_13084 [Minicystis rosea]|nr:hypothetical protein A7982_13084 [Minicystis rosea]
MHDFQFDESQRPIIVVTFPHTITAETCRGLYDRLVALSRRGTKIGYLCDLRKFNPLTSNAALRKLAADTFLEKRHLLARVTVCEARVIEGAISRGFITAYDWMTGTKWPCANFGTMHEAERWVRAQLKGAGVEVRASA